MQCDWVPPYGTYFPKPYNSNITLISYVDNGKDRPLQEDEYYVIMVVDDGYILRPWDKRPDRDFWDKQYHWIGLECTRKHIYISKSFNKRHNHNRGITLIAKVKDTKQCYTL